MDDIFISAEGVCFSYKDENGDPLPALYDIDLEVRRGEFLCILGRNGSGKSTLAKLFNLILTPDSGRIVIDGRDVTAKDFSDDDVLDVRRKIGMVFQNPDNQLVATIVEEDIAFGPENLGVPPEEIRRRVDAALAAVGMSEYARHSPHKLSGGQKQRVAVAGVLAMQPECVIFDESTAMLDPAGRHEVMDTIEKLRRERGLTVIAITHNMDEAVAADRIAVMDRGRVVMTGTPREVFGKTKELSSMGLGVPQAVTLCNLLREAGMPLPDGLLEEHAAADAIAAVLKEGSTEK